MNGKSDPVSGQAQSELHSLVIPYISPQNPGGGLPQIGEPLDFNRVAPDEVPEGKLKAVRYRVDSVIVRENVPAPKSAGKHKRGVIGKAPSATSLRNLVFTLNNCTPQMRSMITLTMTPKCHEDHSIKDHKQVLNAALTRLMRSGATGYVWVREHQRNGSAHWHVFSDMKAHDVPGMISVELSREWSVWFSDQYKRRNLHPDCHYKMSGQCQTWLGCVRVEELRSEAAGLYAAKEGGKRFQKVAPEKWAIDGGKWWGKSRNLECVPICTDIVDASEAACATVEIHGNPVDVVYKLQFNMGLKRNRPGYRPGW